MQLTAAEKTICAQTNVSEAEFIAAKRKRSPFPDADRADLGADGKGRACRCEMTTGASRGRMT